MSPNVNETHCTEKVCSICHPFTTPIAPRTGGGVDNSSTYPQPGEKVVDNLPDQKGDTDLWEGYNDFREAYLAPPSKVPFTYSLFLEKKLGEARRLIAWFALKYQDNNPVFPYRDSMYGFDLEGNKELSRTWFEIVRGGFVCEECEGIGAVLYETGDPGVLRRDRCPECDARGYKTEAEAKDATTDTPSRDDERKSPNDN